ncbi:hypothetical protein [Acidovorax sp.]|uniref:hypothetical protein n=1 Tax=Acidovorax sp. TaxID=1872122 RepID=UPI002ACDD625|nr:hypothetical protein [Acidovorax sp.]MDZ7863089.1 hypothetical protein [Acidovorax sp.]
MTASNIYLPVIQFVKKCHHEKKILCLIFFISGHLLSHDDAMLGGAPTICDKEWMRLKDLPPMGVIEYENMLKRNPQAGVFWIASRGRGRLLLLFSKNTICYRKGELANTRPASKVAGFGDLIRIIKEAKAALGKRIGYLRSD